MKRAPKDTQPTPQPTPGHVDQPSTTPAEEWGDRIETGRAIARSGDDAGEVPGATGDESRDPRSGNDPHPQDEERP